MSVLCSIAKKSNSVVELLQDLTVKKEKQLFTNMLKLDCKSGFTRCVFVGTQRFGENGFGRMDLGE
jgi:hypothetical protein